MSDVQPEKVFGFRVQTTPMRYGQLLSGHKLDLSLGFAFLIIANVIALVVPRLVNTGVKLVELASAQQMTLMGHDFEVSIGPLVSTLFILAIAGALFRTWSRQFIFKIGRNIEKDLRSHLFYHLSLLSLSFYRRHSVGDLMSHLTSDINNVRMVMGFAVLNILNIVILFSATTPILISIDWRIACAVLSPFVLVVVTARLLTAQLFERTKTYQASLSQLTQHIQENLSGAQVIRVFGQEPLEIRKFEKTNEHVFKSAIRLSRIRVVIFPLMRMMGGIGVAITLWVGGMEVASGRMTVGDFVEVTARLLQLTWPAISIGYSISIYNQGKASLDRINTLLKESSDVIDGPYKAEAIHEIEMKDRISFKLKAGEFLGVVGPSGSGKTSFARALLRRTSTPRGTIFFNGIDLVDFNLESLYHHATVVSSEPFLFSTTLRENLLFAKPNTSDEELLKVIEHVGFAPDLLALPDGLDTLVGERGVMLSGGQRQRVALARALIAKPSVLILDDCLSALDAETELHVVKQIKNQFKHGFLIMISHRLSVLKGADEIIVLDRGEVVERGQHAKLIKTGALYRALWGVEQLTQSLIESQV